MNKKALFSFLVVAAVSLVIYFTISSDVSRLQSQTNNKKETIINTISPMLLSSPAFDNNCDIPLKYTCEGENINPPLVFKDVPKEAKSLALVVDDPDAPQGDWVHWLVWNMDSTTTTGIAEHSVPPEAIQGMTDFGQQQYGGPCPPIGIHHYYFKLYALDIKLNISSFSDKTALEKAMENHILAKAELIGTYKKIHPDTTQ